MSAELAQLQEDRAQYQEQLDIVLASLKDDPENGELLGIKAELDSAIEIINDALAEASSNRKPETQRNHRSEPDASTEEAEAAAKSSSRETPQHHDDAARTVVYKVNESILARWVTGDKAFYPARIMSVTGSATAPMYTVKFKSYDTIETLRARDIRPLHTPASHSHGATTTTTSTKRKADGSSMHSSHVERADSSSVPSGSSTPLSPATSAPPPPPSSAAPPAVHAPPSGSSVQPPPPPPPPLSNATPPPPPMSTAIPPPSRFRTIDRFSQGVVSSASPQLYAQPAQFHQQQQQQQQQRTGGFNSTGLGAGSSSATPLGAEEPPAKKFKKIKATKQLEAGKSKWQEFSSKGKTGKPGTKKDSMFRTPEGIHGRVGFTGSGQAMRKDVTRSRHIYQTNDDVD